MRVAAIELSAILQANPVLQRVRLEGISAPVLVPSDYGAYASALTRMGVFPKATMPKLVGEVPPKSQAPTVGIICNDLKALTKVAHIIKAVRDMGAEPLLIPPCADAAVPKSQRDRALKDMAAQLDGLIGPGGDDVDPSIYGETKTYAEGTNVVRDRFEADFALAAMDADCFMFGICRSHQLWNAAAGGKLVQDVQKEGYTRISQRQQDFGIPADKPFVIPGVFENRVELGAALSSIVGANMLLTNSFHHQAVKTPGRGIHVVGIVADDKPTIEATAGDKMLTVQWHPELMMSDPQQARLLETVGRRAQIFHWLKQDPASVATKMRASEIAFDDADYRFAWNVSPSF